MTEGHDDEKPGAPPPPSPPPPRGSRRAQVLGWIVTVGLLLALVTFLALSKPPKLQSSTRSSPSMEVRRTSRDTLRIPSRGPFTTQLRRTTLRTTRTTRPLVEVTGTLMAALPAGERASSIGWEFATEDILSTYADLSQANLDVAYREHEVHETKRLYDARIEAQVRVVQRLRRLVQVGTDSARDLAREEAALIQLRIESARALHDARTKLKEAERQQAALLRGLEQAGLSPSLLAGATPGSAFLVAQVPESRIDLVHVGQECSVRFYGRPDSPRSGRIASILPTVTSLQRTLRVVIGFDDSDGALKPGMFADTGIGTDPRDALMVPAAAAVHVGRRDYVLVGDRDDLTITEVVLGEADGTDIELLSGARAGSTVITDGAVLLKPAIVEALATRGTSLGTPP